MLDCVSCLRNEAGWEFVVLTQVLGPVSLFLGGREGGRDFKTSFPCSDSVELEEVFTSLFSLPTVVHKEGKMRRGRLKAAVSGVKVWKWGVGGCLLGSLVRESQYGPK